jgi:nucleoid DNA-binding protein
VLKKVFKKQDFIEKLSSKTGISKNFSKKLINDLIEIIIINIKVKNFYLKNIGTFNLRFKNERIGRNPKTKKNFIISARNSVVFKPAYEILSKLNKFV